MRVRNPIKTFDTIAQWSELEATMAEHPDWSIRKCKRFIVEGNKLKHNKTI